jgi:hypothetical protein
VSTTPRITPQNRPHYLALAQEAEAILAQRANPLDWISANLQIRTKTRQVVPLHPNWVQRYYFAHRTRRDIILKARQAGISTMVAGLFFADVVLIPNTTSVMLAHSLESTEQLFSIVQLFWDRLPPEEKARVGKPKYNNRRELYLPRMNSRFLVGTAGATTFGRGQTITNLHASEFAIWPRPEEALLAASEAVPLDGRVVIESTANGLGSPFHDRWVAAVENRGQFASHLFVWFESPEYWSPPSQEEVALWREQLQAQGLPTVVGEPPAQVAETNSRLGSPTPLAEPEIGLVRRYQLTLGQLKWARLKQSDLGEQFVQEYPSDWMGSFLASGRGLFDGQALAAIRSRLSTQPAPLTITSLPGADGQRISLAPAALRVWEQPETGEDYVIGCDVAEGLQGGDASCAVVLHRESGRQVGELHGRISPERFARLAAALGRYFNGAMVGVERENHGHSTLNTLRNQLRYSPLYHHVAYDARAGRAVASELGWPTNSATRPILVDDLAEAVTTGSLQVNSASLVDEMSTFIVTNSGRAEAQPGKFDDRVLAAGIAWQIRKRPKARFSTQRPKGM